MTNLNLKPGGNVWRVDRPCRRLLVKRGVAAAQAAGSRDCSSPVLFVSEQLEMGGPTAGRWILAP